jgi:hypothetical protein
VVIHNNIKGILINRCRHNLPGKAPVINKKLEELFVFSGQAKLTESLFKN